MVNRTTFNFTANMSDIFVQTEQSEITKKLRSHNFQDYLKIDSVRVLEESEVFLDRYQYYMCICPFNIRQC